MVSTTQYPPWFSLGSGAGSLTTEAHYDNILLNHCEPQQAEPVTAALLYDAHLYIVALCVYACVINCAVLLVACVSCSARSPSISKGLRGVDSATGHNDADLHVVLALPLFCHRLHDHVIMALEAHSMADETYGEGPPERRVPRSGPRLYPGLQAFQ